MYMSVFSKSWIYIDRLSKLAHDASKNVLGHQYDGSQSFLDDLRQLI